MKHRIVISASLLLVLSLSGCSWFIMDTVQHYPDPSKEPKCDGYTYPIIDGVVAISFGGIAAGLLWDGYTKSRQSCDGLFCGLGETTLGVIALIPAVLYTISSICGLVWAHDCGKKKDAHEKWLSMTPRQQVMFEADWLKQNVRMSRPKPKSNNVISENQERTNQVIRRPAKPGSVNPRTDNIADVNSRDEWGWTPLHYAETVDVAKKLIDRGADVNAKDGEGHTPLHRAVRYDRWDVAKLLIEKGADINARTTSGLTPLGVAIQLNKLEMAELLKKHGGLE